MLVSNDTFLKTGDSGILVCVATNENITWSYNGLPLTNTSLVSVYEEDIVEGGRVYKQSFLQLCSLVTANAGGYTCAVTNGLTEDNATIQLIVSSE